MTVVVVIVAVMNIQYYIFTTNMLINTTTATAKSFTSWFFIPAWSDVPEAVRDLAIPADCKNIMMTMVAVVVMIVIIVESRCRWWWRRWRLPIFYCISSTIEKIIIIKCWWPSSWSWLQRSMTKRRRIFMLSVLSLLSLIERVC